MARGHTTVPKSSAFRESCDTLIRKKVTVCHYCMVDCKMSILICMKRDDQMIMPIWAIVYWHTYLCVCVCSICAGLRPGVMTELKSSTALLFASFSKLLKASQATQEKLKAKHVKHFRPNQCLLFCISLQGHQQSYFNTHARATHTLLSECSQGNTQTGWE